MNLIGELNVVIRDENSRKLLHKLRDICGNEEETDKYLDIVFDEQYRNTKIEMKDTVEDDKLKYAREYIGNYKKRMESIQRALNDIVDERIKSQLDKLNIQFIIKNEFNNIKNELRIELKREINDELNKSIFSEFFKQSKDYKVNTQVMRDVKLSEMVVTFITGQIWGKIAQRLNLVRIEEIYSNKYPDMIALKKNDDESLKNINIEFESISSNFKRHNHPTDKCDVLICWKHDWVDCPKNIEIIELCDMMNENVFIQDKIKESINKDVKNDIENIVEDIVPKRRRIIIHKRE